MCFQAKENTAIEKVNHWRESYRENNLNACREALKEKKVVYGDEFLVAYCHSKFNRGSLLYLSGLPHKLNEHDKRLVHLFSHNVQLAFDNVLLIKESEDTQQELLGRLLNGKKNKNAAKNEHINRVVKLCELLAREYGLSKDSISLFKIALAVNEGCKVALPEKVLNGSGALSEDEIADIKAQTSKNYSALKDSKRLMIQVAALLVRDYHEKWDGSGYPNGLAGEEIDIHCRIAVIADIYYQLLSSNANDDLSDRQRVFELMNKLSGTRFDPGLLELLGKNLERFSQLKV